MTNNNILFDRTQYTIKPIDADTYQNHTGIIYKATNWQYMGLSELHYVYVNEHGAMRSTKNGSGSALSQTELANKGYKVAGKYAKHVYIMRLPKAKKQVNKLGLKVKKPSPDQATFYFEVA